MLQYIKVEKISPLFVVFIWILKNNTYLCRRLRIRKKNVEKNFFKKLKKDLDIKKIILTFASH